MDDNNRNILDTTEGGKMTINRKLGSRMRFEDDEWRIKEEKVYERKGKRMGVTSFWKIALVILICPYLLADMTNSTGKSFQMQKGRMGYTPFGAHASNQADENRLSRLNQAAIVAAAESFQLIHQNQQQPFLKDSTLSSSMLSPLTVVDASNNNNVINHTMSYQANVQSLIGQRWGHTAAYLKNENVILFTGGQVQGVQEGDQMVTNDVFALDMANATIANGDFGGNNSTGIQRWKRLSSNKLPPHAFAARAITHTGNHSGERVFLIGGATADCSISNSPVYIWESGNDNDWQTGQWTTPTIAPNQQIPPRRKGATAIQVPVTLGMNETEASEAQNQGGISFMVLGGYVDYTTCNGSIPVNMQQPTEYPYVDVWTIGANLSMNNQKRDNSNIETLSVRTMPIDMRMPNMSIIDYSTIVLPANQTAGLNSRIMFIGGRDAYGVFTPMNRIWTLDLVKSTWQWVDTTNGTNSGLDIPLGRMGHSSTLLDDGTILVHGGYVTLDSDQTASNDTYLLDPRVAPAVWHRVDPKPGEGGAPSRAYHTAIIADGIFMIGFGQDSMGNTSMTGSAISSSNIAISKRQNTEAQEEFISAAGPAHYLDTRATNNWSWNTNLDTLLAMRSDPNTGSSDVSNQPLNSQAAQSASAAAISSSQPSPSSSPSPSKSPSSSNLSSNSEKEETQSNTASSMTNSDSATSTPSSTSIGQIPSSSDPKSTQPNADDDNAENSSGSEGSSSAKTKTNTAVIASVLGAAAIVASLGGLYAARKRQSAARMNDNDSLGDDDKYERFAVDQKAPPVSSLWINQPKAWANNAGKGLRRQASMASEAFLARTMSFRNGNTGRQNGRINDNSGSRWLGNWRNSSSSPMNGQELNRSFSSPNGFGSFEVLRNLPPSSRLSIRRSEMQRQKDIKSRLSVHENGQDDENMVDVMLGDEVNLPDEFIRSLLDDEDTQAQEDIRRTVGAGGRQRSILRARSSDTLSSVDGASHFSYPYLADMHRTSGGGLFASNSQNLSPTSSQGAGLTDNESPFSDRNAKEIQNRPIIVSPRQALLRASLSRSPSSPSLFSYSPAAAAAAAALRTSNGSPALMNALFTSGKNGRLSQQVQNMMINSSSPIPNIRFGNPFLSAEEEGSETFSPMGSSAYEEDELEKPTTELDLATTILGGINEEDENLTPKQNNSPSVMSALFPWQSENSTTPLALTSQISPRNQTVFKINSEVNQSPFTKNLPFYQQPSTGVRLPIHPALLNAAAKQSNNGSPSIPSDRINGPRRGRPSLLRVTNQSEEQE